MIPPQDLKNKNFSRTVRGYNPIEVDDYIEFLLGKYEQLHKENTQLEKRLHIVSGKYEELANDEETIRNAVSQAQKLSEAMIQAAEKSAGDIIDKVNKRCEDIIEDAQIKVEAEERKLAELRMKAARFKQMLLKEYTSYLKTVRENEIPSPEEVQTEFPGRDLIQEAAMDGLVPDEIIEQAVLAPSKDPELEEFKRFIRPRRKRLSREEKDALKQARLEGKRISGHLTDQILQSSVDEEDPSEDTSVSFLAETPEMSVEEALTSHDGTDVAHPLSRKADNVPVSENTVDSDADKTE